MTPTERAIDALPPHLRRWVVVQDYAAYSAEDQATWRLLLGRLTAQLADTADPRYLAGLALTGITVDHIPSLDEMNLGLARAGWSAVGVGGFIPPAVFTELQARRVLAIATGIRRPEHLDYTPAPDIVHESAGHAPFVADPRYAEYLQACGEVGFRAIPAAEDLAVFEAVRHLSEVKERRGVAPAEEAAAERRLAAAQAAVPFASEGARASRLYWWTAEYGLVGGMDAPRLYGAGLLSSLGESARCLGPAVARRPLDAGCAEVPFDITHMQPQLFVVRDFDRLFEVLEAFAATLSFRRGGDHGLAEALRARTVVQLGLPGGRELSGQVVQRWAAPAPLAAGLRTALVHLAPPVLRSRGGRAEGGWVQHPGLVAFGRGVLPPPGPFTLRLESGLRLSGRHLGGGEVEGLAGALGGRPLELPARALLELAEGLPSVAGGPADPGLARPAAAAGAVPLGGAAPPG
ncbi:MAG: aromatic amino acid hydroxylase [Anaeromyxobacter sp.]|nr:aromatic amino acid hydroxylase [Anaeromyxobacter sp.]MBL0278544.1 aromatic amino acid hydroxylase [Anaeromyxobacter sp.]